jgi:hypothetical protein
MKLKRSVGKAQLQMISLAELPRFLHVGMGHTTRKNVEFCLLFRRGNASRLRKDVQEAIISPVREHSRKPDEAYERALRYAADPTSSSSAAKSATGGRRGAMKWASSVAERDPGDPALYQQSVGGPDLAPHNMECEAALLGALMIDNKARRPCADGPAAAFLRPVPRLHFRHDRQMASRRPPGQSGHAPRRRRRPGPTGKERSAAYLADLTGSVAAVIGASGFRGSAGAAG